MNPNQCGTGRNLDTLHPGDRAAIEWFRRFLTVSKIVDDHLAAVGRIMKGKRRLQLIAAAPYHVDDFVKVTDETDPRFGRWGMVVDVIDYREGDVPRPDRLEFLIMVSLKTTRPGIGMVEYPPAPVPFEPCEIAPLFAGEAGGDWVRSGRVVSEKHWPPRRTGLTDSL